MSNANPEERASQLAARLAKLSPEKRALLQRTLAARSLGGEEAVARSLRECGITHIFGVAGLPTEKILPACLDQNIRPIGVHHQSAAALMATAYNYQVGNLAAAALVSAGPAVTNAVTGLLVARDNAWPLILLGGRRSSFQKSEPLLAVRQVVKHAIDVPNTSSIHECIRHACQVAVAGRPGPVYVELHEDVLSGYAEADSFDDPCSIRPCSSDLLIEDTDVARIADALVSAHRPALIVGKGIRWTVIPDQLRELIEMLGLPFMTSPMGRGFVPDDHPMCCNQARTVLQSQADVVLIIGARLNWVFRHGVEFSRDARVIVVDLVDDVRQHTTISTEFINGDAGDFIARLLVAVHDRKNGLEDPIRRERLVEWYRSLTAASNETRHRLDRQMLADRGSISPYRMMKEIREALPRDAICVTDGNISMRVAQAVIPAFRPASRMDAGTNACMGVGIPFGIGAKIACPDRPVVVVTGDYAFSLGAMEMEVCVRQGIPIVVVVANNQGNNGAIKQKAYFPRENAELVTMFQPGIQYDRISKAFGGEGTTVADAALIKPALLDAIACGKTSCLNIVIAPDLPLPNAWGEQSSNE
jgi:thiamine pyrophosphate-dependent acetolactate synthase large subunit-like protein